MFLDPILTNYGVIIVNDVHKRHVLCDTILALLKKIVRKRSTLKIVLVSNTKEANFFAEYFNSHKQHHKNHQIMCTVLSIDDHATKQDIFYLNSPCADYISKSIETLRNIHQKQPSDGDVVVYLADDDEINHAMEILKNYINMDHIKNLNYFKLSQVSNEKQSVFFPKTDGKRNVIFTTELYQDSVTQDRIGYGNKYTSVHISSNECLTSSA